jgi:prepilin-type N-terminal cleavage/methylation domain-containing protein
MSKRPDGFTLLEVVVAVFVLGTAVGALVQYLGDHLARLADARLELEAAQLAAERLREIRSEVEAGTYPEEGRTEGAFEAPHEHLRWMLDVEPGTLALPILLADDVPRSSVFEQPAPSGGTGPAIEPSLLRITLRVVPENREDAESIPPYVMYFVKPVQSGFFPGSPEAPEEPS